MFAELCDPEDEDRFFPYNIHAILGQTDRQGKSAQWILFYTTTKKETLKCFLFIGISYDGRH